MPRIILLDGPSGSGKSRLKSELLQACPELDFCQRVTTRPSRDEASDADYRFVTPEEFHRLESSGKLAAWRHFEFGMSYGLPRVDVEESVREGRQVLALIDLGTGPQVKKIWPHCVTVLLYTPLNQLRGRLQAREGHSAEQIEERLGNAEKVWALRHHYDHVLLNLDGQWEKTLAEMLAICRPTTS